MKLSEILKETLDEAPLGFQQTIAQPEAFKGGGKSYSDTAFSTHDYEFVSYSDSKGWTMGLYNDQINDIVIGTDFENAKLKFKQYMKSKYKATPLFQDDIKFDAWLKILTSHKDKDDPNTSKDVRKDWTIIDPEKPE